MSRLDLDVSRLNKKDLDVTRLNLRTKKEGFSPLYIGSAKHTERKVNNSHCHILWLNLFEYLRKDFAFNVGILYCGVTFLKFVIVFHKAVNDFGRGFVILATCGGKFVILAKLTIFVIVDKVFTT